MDFLLSSRKQKSSKQSLPRQHIDRRELSPNELLTYAEDLETQLETLEVQRADLLRELEAYAGASANFTWEPTALLRDRVFNAEVQLSHFKESLQQVTAERDSLSEDFVKLKEVKRLSDQSCREVNKKVTHIEKELDFYQKQAVDAMQARDRAGGEASRMQERVHSLEDSLKKKEIELRTERSATAELRQRLLGMQREKEELQRRADVATQVPTLRLDLQETQSAMKLEQQARIETQEALRESEQKLEQQAVRERQLEEQCGASEKRSTLLVAELQDCQQQRHSLEQRLQKSEAALQDQQSSADEAQQQAGKQLTEAQERVSLLERQAEALQLQVEEAQAESAAAADKRAAAAEQACASAEGRASSLEELHQQTAAELKKALSEAAALKAELGSAQAAVDDLTSKIAEVAEEKLLLLVENADLREREREGTTQERDDDDDAWGAWPWKRAAPAGRFSSPGKTPPSVRQPPPASAPATS